MVVICKVCLRGRVGVDTSVCCCGMVSSWEKAASLLSEPERQCRVCTELRLMKRLGLSDWVGSETLLSFFWESMGVKLLVKIYSGNNFIWGAINNLFEPFQVFFDSLILLMLCNKND